MHVAAPPAHTPTVGWCTMSTPVSAVEPRKITKLLVANRGEIAVRVIRAARDAGIASVAVYADQDINAIHAGLADEAYALGGDSAADTYLSIEKLISVARRAGADAVHPGYGFLSENADFAQAVIDAGLIWVGPPPAAIVALGDKVSARHIAEQVGAPLAPGTVDPVSSADEIVAFAEQVGLPVAIKAAFGGGGRGLKVAHTIEEIPALFESATREAVAAFGRGECFVEKFLVHPRHVETQCLADAHGNVVVVSTRDCSLQRRNQKLVEEAPAPFLTDEQQHRLYEASKAILRAAGYVGAGTCEFLIGRDGTVSFLEVNTRLQVEHPVSEEISGIDLVREQFRIAEGGELDYSDPELRGHSIEFRINGEDPGNNFLPAPGVITSYRGCTGPGVRVDSGVTGGDVISGAFDSLLAKVIITGATREQALERARRALAEFEITGIPTALPFHRVVVNEPDFVAADGDFKVHTTWIENDFDNRIAPWSGSPAEASVFDSRSPVVLEVDGRRIEVTVPDVLIHGDWGTASQAAPKRRFQPAEVSGTASNAVTTPMQASVIKVDVTEGQRVLEGDPLVVLEAMKMEQPITASRAGYVRNLQAPLGQTVSAGHVLLTIEDE